MPTPAEQVKERLNIVDVVSAYLPLTKAGVNFKGRCPFHNEKTASFFVSPTRQSFHCFGCNKGGDAITFVQEIEGLEFIEALKQLATKAGIELKLTGTNALPHNREREEVVAVLLAATKFYQKKLNEHEEVKKYLLDRGLTVESIEQFNLGFAPLGWRHLVDYLVAEGFSLGLIEKAGLAIMKKEGAVGQSHYDRFRGRIMFPLADAGGVIVGFSGRIFDHDNSRAEEAKYLNSPQTIVYDKSRLLYGLDKARVAIRRQDRAILVEGQMDLVMCHQAGLVEAVAVSGTALTEQHLLTLKRLSSNLYMAFDADSAGIAASRRALELALGLGLEVRIVSLPEGKDPADVVKTSPDSLLGLVKKAEHVIDFYLSVLTKKYSERRERAHAIKRDIYSLVSRLPERIDQAHFIGKIAELTNIKEEVVWADIKESTANVKTANSSPPAITAGIKTETESRLAKIFRQLIGLLWQLGDKNNEVLEKNKIYKLMEDLAGTVFVRAGVERLLPQKDKIMLEIEIGFGAGLSDLEKIVEELYANFKDEFLKRELVLATKKLKEAEVVGDEIEIDKCLKKCQDISNLINKKA